MSDYLCSFLYTHTELNSLSIGAIFRLDHRAKSTTSSIKTVFNSLFSLVFTVHLKILADIVIPRLQSYDISFIFKNHIKYVTFFKSAYIKTSISSLGDSTRREAYFSHIFKNI